MPGPLLRLDTTQDAEVEATPQQIANVRTGYVDDIDVSGDSDADALLKVMPFLPQWLSPLSALSPSLKLARVRIRPEPAKFRRVRVWLTYETQVANMTPTAYMLRDRTFLVQATKYFLPGSNIPVIVGFEKDSSSDSAGRALETAAQALDFECTMSARSLQLTILQYARPDNDNAADFVNYVNNDNWPVGDFQFNNNQTGSPGSFGIPLKSAKQYPKGYWKLTSYSTEFNRNANMTLVQAEALTKVVEDWSQIAMLTSSITGRLLFPQLNPASRAAILSALFSPDYAHNIIYPTGATRQKGIVRFGPFPMTNFQTLFGF